jgi:predicted nucleic acid-binding protein
VVVIDSSFILAHVLPDEMLLAAEELLKQMEDEKLLCWVPPLFYLETTNVLHMLFRRKRIDAKIVEAGVEIIRSLPLQVDTAAAHGDSMTPIAQYMTSYDLTSYDASYLELAKRRSLMLATLDKALQRAASMENLLYPAFQQPGYH